tara:strand:+ start:168 stop:395 length:228 start_codon:yes stop_codon:yes gene_type:complete
MKIFNNKGGAQYLSRVLFSNLRKIVKDDKVLALIDEPNKTKYDMLFLLDKCKDYADKKAMAIILTVENFLREERE